MLAGLPPRYSLVLNTSEYLVSMTIHRHHRDHLLWTVSLPRAFLVLTILVRLPLCSATPWCGHLSLPSRYLCIFRGQCRSHGLFSLTMLARLLPRYSLVLNTSEYLVSMAIHRRRRDRLLRTVCLPRAFLVLTILARLLLRYSLVWPSIIAVKIPVCLSWTASFPWALLLDNACWITAPLLPSVEH